MEIPPIIQQEKFNRTRESVDRTKLGHKKKKSLSYICPNHGFCLKTPLYSHFNLKGVFRGNEEKCCLGKVVESFLSSPLGQENH